MKKASKIRKVLSHIFTAVIGFLFVALLGIEIISMVTKGGNYGVPNVFGYQMMHILTDSMVPVYPVDSAIIVTKFDVDTVRGKGVCKLTNIANDDYVTSNVDEDNYVDPNSYLQLGDDISFYWNKDGVPAPYIITHRVLEMHFKDDGSLSHLVCNGINKGENNNTGKAQTPVTPELILGKVTYCSKVLGWAVVILQSPLTLILLIIIPCGYVAITSIIDIVNVAKEGKEEKTLSLEEQMRLELIKEGVIEDDSLSSLNQEELAKLKEEMLDEIKKEEEDPLKDLSQEDKERLIKELLEEEMKKGE